MQNSGSKSTPEVAVKPPSRLKDQLAYIIACVNRQIEEDLHERLRPAGVAPDQLRILEVLQGSDGRSMGELASLALIEPTTLTKVIDRMVSNSLVYRLPDPADRRRVLIRIAPAGQALFRRLDRISSAVEERLQRQVPPEKLDELRGLLLRLMEG